MSLRRQRVVQENSNHQRQANPYWKRHCQSGNIDRRDQQQVCHVENRAGCNCILNVRRVRLLQVVHECQRSAASAAESKSPNNTAQQNSNHVVPIKKLERVTSSQFHRVRPRAPTNHARSHERERNTVSFRLIHEILFSPEFRGASGSYVFIGHEIWPPCLMVKFPIWPARAAATPVSIGAFGSLRLLTHAKKFSM